MASLGNLTQIEAVTLNHMGELLGELAAQWRETKDAELVTKYQALLICMVEMGWQGTLDYEDHLPSSLMPAQYEQHIKRLQEQRRSEMKRVPDWRDFQSQ